MKAIRLMAIALLTSLAAILVFSSAAGHRLAHESPTVIFDYDVTNDYGILFADEFERLGGAEALGYPASYRFRLDDGFVYQVTQGALLQWRPEVRKAYLGNTFEMLEKAGYDQWLLDTKGIPLPIKEDGSGGDWNKARQTRLAWLTNENIKAKYLANPNPGGDSVLERGPGDSAVRAADVLSGETRPVRNPTVPAGSVSAVGRRGRRHAGRWDSGACPGWRSAERGVPGTVACAGAGGTIQLRLIDDHAAEIYASPSVLDIYTAWVVIGFTAAAP